MLDLNDVATFVHVVKAGSFAAAGRQLGVPSNTLSRRVQVLEAALGTRLLVRSTRKLNLTTSGATFYAQCAGGVADLEQAGASLLDITVEPAGSVRVAAPADFFNHFPMAWMAEFMAMHPKVRLEFLLDDRQVDFVDESVDVAFRAGKIEDSSLVARKLVDSTRALFASPGFIALHEAPASLDALAQAECVTSPSLAGRTVWRLTGAEGETGVSVSGRFRASTVQAQAHAAVAGLGIAFLPIAMTARDVADGRLVRVLPDYAHHLGGVYAVSPTRRLRAPAVVALIGFVAERLKQLVEAGTHP